MLETDRLLLRRWREEDLEPFARMNADPVVMEHFPALLSRSESDALAARADQSIGADGFGLWAVEVKGGPPFCGFVGLNRYRGMPFPDGVEVGWRLDHAVWGRGYAPEAAVAALRSGFTACGLDEICSFTAAVNTRSRRVMDKIGMHRHPDDDFTHPRIDPASPLAPHVRYRLRRAEWLATRAAGDPR